MHVTFSLSLCLPCEELQGSHWLLDASLWVRPGEAQAACLEFMYIFREWLLQLWVHTNGGSNKHFSFLTFLMKNL